MASIKGLCSWDPLRVGRASEICCRKICINAGGTASCITQAAIIDTLAKRHRPHAKCCSGHTRATACADKIPRIVGWRRTHARRPWTVIRIVVAGGARADVRGLVHLPSRTTTTVDHVWPAVPPWRLARRIRAVQRIVVGVDVAEQAGALAQVRLQEPFDHWVVRSCSEPVPAQFVVVPVAGVAQPLWHALSLVGQL